MNGACRGATVASYSGQWRSANGSPAMGPVGVHACKGEREGSVPFSLPVGLVMPNWLVWVQKMGRGHVMILHARFGLDLI